MTKVYHNGREGGLIWGLTASNFRNSDEITRNSFDYLLREWQTHFAMQNAEIVQI